MLPLSRSDLGQVPLLVAASCLAACVFVAPLDEKYTLRDDTANAAGGTAGSGGSNGGGDIGGAGGNAAGTAGGGGGVGGGLICGEALTASSDECPPICDGCTENNTVCNIDCGNGQDSCMDSTIYCPAGKHCDVNCATTSSCKDTAIYCPDGRNCSVQCSTGNSCQNANIHCSADGPCDVSCGAEALACATATVTCGANACSCSSAGSDPPDMLCTPSCECTEC